MINLVDLEGIFSMIIHLLAIRKVFCKLYKELDYILNRINLNTLDFSRVTLITLRMKHKLIMTLTFLSSKKTYRQRQWLDHLKLKVTTLLETYVLR